MERVLLMTVDEVFDLDDRMVLAPGVERHVPIPPSGSLVELVRPDGTTRRVQLVGVEFPTPNLRHVYPLAIAPGLPKHEVPSGTEVWTVEGAA